MSGRKHRVAWPAYNEMSFAGVVGSGADNSNIRSPNNGFEQDNNSFLKSYNNADTLGITERKSVKPISAFQTHDLTSTDHQKSVQTHLPARHSGSPNTHRKISNLKSAVGMRSNPDNMRFLVQSTYPQQQPEPLITTKDSKKTYNQNSTQMHTRARSLRSPNTNRKNSNLTFAAGKRSKPENTRRFLVQSAYPQQQPEPLFTPQFQSWNATICSPPKSNPRRSSPRKKRHSASQSKKRPDFLFEEPTTDKMTREHLQNPRDAIVEYRGTGNLLDERNHEEDIPAHFPTQSPPSTIFSEDAPSSVSSQLRIIGAERRWSPRSPWHAPTTEYSLPPQAFLEHFQRNRCAHVYFPVDRALAFPDTEIQTCLFPHVTIQLSVSSKQSATRPRSGR